MRYFLPVLLLYSGVLKAQTFEQPDQPKEKFPFSIVLTSADSTQQISSAKLFKTDKPTVLAFWLTTCMPCQMELAAYTRHYETWKKEMDFNFYAISTDWPERFKHIAEKARTANWPFPVYWEGKRSFHNILPGDLNGLPQVFIFDKKGNLVWRHRRYAPGDELLMYERLKKLKDEN